RHCDARLLAAGWDVHAVGRGGCAIPGVVGHTADLLTHDSGRLIEAVQPSHLLHLAWVTTPGKYWTAPENADWVTASQRLVRAFLEQGGQRVIIAGTYAEYDWSIGGVCHERQTPTRPATVYGRAKDELRRWVEQFAPASWAW